MKTHLAKVPNRVALITLAAVLLVGACASRYRLDMFMTFDEQRNKVKVEQTQFILDANLADPRADTKVSPGADNVLIVTVGGRGHPAEGEKLRLFSWDEYTRCQIFIQVPQVPRPVTLDLQERSFVFLLGNYDWPIDDKVFEPDSGTFVIDSVVQNELYATIDGVYRNGSDAAIAAASPGETVPEGTVVAVAIARAGVTAFRRSVNASERGPLCGMGLCGECRVTINGRAHQRSCQTLCESGMEVITDDV